MISDAGENVGEPGLRVHVVELCRRDHRRHDGGTVGAALGTGEEPRLSAEGGGESAARARSAALFVRQIRPIVKEKRVNRSHRRSI